MPVETAHIRLGAVRNRLLSRETIMRSRAVPTGFRMLLLAACAAAQAACAACHARMHRLSAMRRWIPEALAPLWAEQHPGAPLQLQLPLEALL